MSITIPKSITPSPLKDSSIEVRFETSIPEEAVYGILLPICKKLFEKDPLPLMIMNLPIEIRKQDPNLRFQSWYRVTKETFVFSFGPHSISLGCLPPYCGWEKWYSFVKTVFEGINTTILKDVNVLRIGMRNINSFQKELDKVSNIKLSISDLSYLSFPATIHWEKRENDVLFYINAIANGKKLSAFSSSEDVVIDIDCIKEVKDLKMSEKKIISIIDEVHSKLKEMFFSLLDKDFLSTLNPEF